MSSSPPDIRRVPDDPYDLRDQIRVPPIPVVHSEEEYDSRGFHVLSAMQRDHFWYRGRHRFLLHAIHRHFRGTKPPRVIDLGGGCGGWITYFDRHKRFPTSELALADSSLVALQFAAQVLPESVCLYQTDLLNLQWHNRWDVAFLLDVLEHIPDHVTALRQIAAALTPGGLLFVTVPALRQFWTWNDELVGHRRRYARKNFIPLAQSAGLVLLQARYFMFFLSPLLLASRLSVRRNPRRMLPDDQWALLEWMHRVPGPVLNGLLGSIFSSETPLGHLIPFPWGTSLLAVLQKPI